MSFVDVNVNINDKFSAFWMYRFLGAPQILLNNSDEGAIFEDRWRAAANLLQFFTSHWLLPLPTSDQRRKQYEHSCAWGNTGALYKGSSKGQWGGS